MQTDIPWNGTAHTQVLSHTLLADLPPHCGLCLALLWTQCGTAEQVELEREAMSIGHLGPDPNLHVVQEAQGELARGVDHCDGGLLPLQVACPREGGQGEGGGWAQAKRAYRKRQ